MKKTTRTKSEIVEQVLKNPKNWHISEEEESMLFEIGMDDIPIRFFEIVFNF